ncbi:MAG: sodium-translocating pyrophosphatase [Promethearchaeota archaeon]
MFTTFMQLDIFAQLILIGVIIVAIISFIYSWWLRQDVMKQDTGTDEMKKVWYAIKEGADAYLWKQLKTILPIVIILTGALFLSVYLVHPSRAAEDEFAAVGLDPVLMIAIGRTVAFMLGAGFSLMVGQFGMRIAVHGNLRVAAAAAGAMDENGKLLDVDRRYNKALSIAYHAGTVTGMLTDGFGLLGGTAIFIAFGTAAPDALLGFGFGGTILALFMRVGGGIYTKAADVGADLVGKVEKDIPEDDPRNAAVIADLVGDNVGDCAGMAADIFESYEVTIVSSLILGLFLFELSGGIVDGHIVGDLVWIMFPLIVRGIGVISSIIGTFAVALWKTPDAEKAMFNSYELSSAITITTSAIFAIFYVGDWRLALLIATGVMLAVSFNPITARFTSKERGPVKEVVDSMHGGPATTILSGLALGYESSVWAVVVICISFVISVGTFLLIPGNEIFGGFLGIKTLLVMKEEILQYMLYGIALIGIGMLSHTGNNVAMDSFGPISDNAQGIAEMTSMDKESASVLEELDAVGNTTKAITKGIAIASAVIAAVSLFASFVTDVQVVVDNLQEAGIQITNPLLNGLRVNIPAVFVGLLLGAALPWIFAAFNIRAVSRAARDIIEEVRRQFKIPGIMEGTKKPDYERAVSISTSAAQKELVSLAVIAVSIPIIVGIIFGAMIILGLDILAADLDAASRETIRSTIGSGVEVLGGFQAGIIASGQLLAVFMANAGGAWDNAKKAVEDEPRDSDKNMGKGSERHKAGVVGDTVGDPLKDTAGPALNPMIKVVNLISLILAPLLVEASVNSDLSVILVIVAIVLFVLFIWAYRKSNRKTSPLTT